MTAWRRFGGHAARPWLVLAVAALAAAATVPPHAIAAASKLAEAPGAAKVASAATEIVRLGIAMHSESTVLTVAATPQLPAYHTFVLRHPDRWVVDFQNAHNGLPREHWTIAKGGVSDVRAAQFEQGVVRIVLDLNQPLRPKLSAERNQLRIVIPASPEASLAPASDEAKKELAALISATKAAPRNDEKVRGSGSSSMDAKTQPAPWSAPLPSTSRIEPIHRAAPSLPAAPAMVPSPRPNAAAAPVMPLAAASSTPSAKKSAAAVQAAEHFQALAYTPAGAGSGQPAAAAPNAAAGVQAPQVTPRGETPASLQKPLVGVTPGTGEPTEYTGERITLNLKNADLADFFRLINQISGLNIIVDPNVKGTVTMVLQNVPWDQALDIVLRNNDLGRKLEGNVLYIATMKTLQAQNQQVADLKKSQEAAAPFVDRVLPLSYAKADDVAKILTTKGFILGENEMVTTDSRTNALILHIHPETLPAVDALVTRLDRKTPQVEIEARVVAASRNFVRDLGVQLGFGAGNAASAAGGVNAVGAGQTVSGIASPKYPLTGTGLLPLNVNLGAAAPTSGLAFINASRSFRLDAILSAAESKGLGHILSRPKIVTQNNMQAMVQQGVRIPVQTTINNTISVQFFNVTLRLTVTPQITAENTIFMNVDVENDSIDSGIPAVNGIPAIDTQQATTNVLVADGGTVVIGGVMINNNQNTVFQVPVLGSLPVLGNLFKRTVINNTSQELLFFITPRIVPS